MNNQKEFKFRPELRIYIMWFIVTPRDGNGHSHDRSWLVMTVTDVSRLKVSDRPVNRLTVDRGLTDSLTDDWPQVDRWFNQFLNRNLPKKRFLVKFFKRKNVFGKIFTIERFFGKFWFKNRLNSRLNRG